MAEDRVFLAHQIVAATASRAGEDPMGTEANRKARTAAWERWKELLKKI